MIKYVGSFDSFWCSIFLPSQKLIYDLGKAFGVLSITK